MWGGLLGRPPRSAAPPATRAPSPPRLTPNLPVPLPQAGDKIEAFEVVQKSLKLEEARAATVDMSAAEPTAA